MAQYVEVLSPSDRSTGEVRQFLANIEGDNPGVQYVISPSNHQQLQTQQIVVSDQLMVVETQHQQIAVDQSQITYQQPVQQYIIQESSMAFQGNKRIFYTEEPPEQVVPEQSNVQQTQTVIQAPAIHTQPIVLNHQMSTSSPMIRSKLITSQMQQHGISQTRVGSTLRQPSVQQQVPTMSQSNQQIRIGTSMRVQQPRQPSHMAQQRMINQPQKTTTSLPVPALIQTSFPRQINSNKGTAVEFPAQQMKLENPKPIIETEEAVALPDGTVVSLSAYKKILAEQKQHVDQPQARNPNSSPVRPPNPQAQKRARNPTPSRSNRGGVRANPRANPRLRVPMPQVTSTTPTNNPLPAAPQRFMLNQQHQHLKQQQQTQQTQIQQQHPQQGQNLHGQQYQMQNQQSQVMQQQRQQQHRQNVQQMQHHQQVQQQQPLRQSQANYVIQPPHINPKPQQQMPLPPCIRSSQIKRIIENTPVSEEYSDSIRMLVLLANREQRLITFTLPKEACTIQEILEQVQVPFEHDTNIQVTEANSYGINYIVTVGNVPNFGNLPESDPEMDECSVGSTTSEPSAPQQLQQLQAQPLSQSQPQIQLPTVKPLMKPPSPELPKELSPKLVPGKLAVCGFCGYLNEDFNKCSRCKRKLPDNVKVIATSPTSASFATQVKKPDLRTLVAEKKLSLVSKTSNGGSPRQPTSPSAKKKGAKSKAVEHELVVVSSDEEGEEEKKSTHLVNKQLLQKLGNSVTISPVTKEPTLSDIQRNSVSRAKAEPVPDDDSKYVQALVHCRTVRIGSYRFVPLDLLCIDSKGFTMKVPHPKLENEVRIIKIDKSDIVKVLVSFNKSLPVVFYYVIPSAAATVRELLDMQPGGDNYFDPLSEKEESHRRITLLPEELSDGDRDVFIQIYSTPPPNIMDELSAKEANDILIKTCPKELAKPALGLGSLTEIKQLLLYPPEGRGRISINTEDYVCLAQDQFLNDVIIDFYLKYLVLNLPKERQDKVHVFSTFFYKRLTTKPIKASRKSQPAELDPNLTAAQKRHARVKTWTKGVNLFEKDFIIVPINENAHWFLAIISFPSMDGCHTLDGQPIKIESKRAKKAAAASATPAPPPVKEKVEKPIMCEDPDASDKDEAEGDDSELESDESEEITPTPPPQTQTAQSTPKAGRPPIKQPCILIFDSLAGASRSRVVATLRDYLTCEYKAKMNQDKTFTKDVIKGACPKVPQQTNFTDCGLYLLQYVEQFFNDPVKDYYIPISHLKTWFDELTVTKKREDISLLIKHLMKQNGRDISILPDIMFPTLNGKIVERSPEDEDEMDEEDYFEDIEEPPSDEEENELENSEPTDTTPSDVGVETGANGGAVEENVDGSPMKPSSESVSSEKDSFEQTIVQANLKPDISELPKVTSRDTLSYLKAKRIIRHKNGDEPDTKKLKSD